MKATDAVAQNVSPKEVNRQSVPASKINWLTVPEAEIRAPFHFSYSRCTMCAEVIRYL